MKNNISLLTISFLISVSLLEAKTLEKAIQNVDISGSVGYRFDTYSGAGEKVSDRKSARGTYVNRYKIAVNAFSKINDDFKFNTRVIAAESNRSNAQTLPFNNSGDKNLDVTVEHLNFSYNGLKNSAVTLGKQIVATPWTNRLLPFAGASSGTGVTAFTTLSNVSLFGGFYNQTNIANFKGGGTGLGLSVNGQNYNVSSKNITNSGEDLAYAGALAKFGIVNTTYTIMDIQDVLTSQFFKIGLNTNLSDFKINTYLQYSITDLHSSFKEFNGIKDDDISLLKFGLNVKKDIFSAEYLFAKTGENGSGIIHRQSESSIFYWTSSPENYYDATVYAGNIGVQILSSLKLSLYAMMIDTKKDEEVIKANKTDAADEYVYYLQSAYQASKNFNIVSQLGVMKNDFYTDKSNIFRTNIVFSF